MKYFIWDFDGTLFDTYRFITLSFQKALQDFNIVEDLNKVEKEVTVSVESATKYYAERFQIPSKSLGESYKKYSHNFDFHLIKPFQDVKKVLQKIAKSGGKNYIYTHRGKSTLDILKHYKLENYFVEIVSSENGFARKPSPDALCYLIQKHNMDPKDTLYIGDREIDMLCGKNANIHTCFFSQEKQCEIANFNIKYYKDFDGIFLKPEPLF